VTKVFLLALAASLDAGLVAAVVLLLGRPRPQRQLLAFWFGAIGLSTAIGLVIVLALGRSGLRVNQHGSASPAIEITAGVVLLAIAVTVGSGLTDRLTSERKDRHHDQDVRRRPSLADRLRGSDSVKPAFLAGVAYGVPGAYYLAGLALLVKLDAGTAADIVAVLAFNLVMLALLELPIVGFAFAPDRTRALVSRLDGWLTRHRRAIVGVAAGAIGLYLLISGLVGLS
jgi:Sap, sulfolipid-1-addressing protein